MNNKKSQFLHILLYLLAPSFAQADSNFDFFIETGAVWQNRNDTEIPPGTGTRLSIDEFNKGPFFHYRLEGYYRINKQHALRLVYAPLEIEVSGRANDTVVFDGSSFPNTADLNVKYKFNSYRLTYIYGFSGFGDDQLNLGITAKVRDASTTLSQSSISESYSNVGFVPLLYFEYQKSLYPNWSLNFNLDAAAASQGRAVDAALKLRHQIKDNLVVGVGMRTLEGGAENNKVFTFSWFNYAVLDVKVVF
jgi:hypothetical protein